MAYLWYGFLSSLIAHTTQLFGAALATASDTLYANCVQANVMKTKQKTNKLKKKKKQKKAANYIGDEIRFCAVVIWQWQLDMDT